MNFRPLKVGDSVIFTIMDPPDDSLAGMAEGRITKIYDTQDETIKNGPGLIAAASVPRKIL